MTAPHYLPATAEKMILCSSCAAPIPAGASYINLGHERICLRPICMAYCAEAARVLSAQLQALGAHR